MALARPVTRSLRPSGQSLLVKKPAPPPKNDSADLPVMALDERDAAESEESTDEENYTPWAFKFAGTFAYLRAGSLDGSDNSDYCHESRDHTSDEVYSSDEEDDEEW